MGIEVGQKSSYRRCELRRVMLLALLALFLPQWSSALFSALNEMGIEMGQKSSSRRK
jgi:hypothetical protein